MGIPGHPRRHKSQHRIRLAEIDARESKQAFGQRATSTLKLCFGKHAEVRNTSADRYQRVVGTVYYATVLNANSELVRQGMAWGYVQYARQVLPAFALETTARTKNRPLGRSSMQRPWEWRRAGRLAGTGRPIASLAPTASTKPHQVALCEAIVAQRSLVCCRYDAVGPQNRVEFSSERAAASAGFRKAGNCR
ncbi:MAG: thermonuclease family protein [Chloroflexi bacterium]|nr:thermonuclease family protein [Chloroflexota bacterium]